MTSGDQGTYKEALSGLCREHKQKDGRDREGEHIWRDTMQKGTTGDRRNKTSLVGESSDKGCLLSTFPSEGVNCLTKLCPFREAPGAISPSELLLDASENPLVRIPGALSEAVTPYLLKIGREA